MIRLSLIFTPVIKQLQNTQIENKKPVDITCENAIMKEKMKTYQKDLGKAFTIKVLLLIALGIFFSVYKMYNTPHTAAYEEIYK